MKAKRENITIRELFKQKLENAEVVPDAALKSKLMRRVARQEFLRFNPGSFNVFYLGGILLAGAVASLLLFSGQNTNYRAELILRKADTSHYSAAAPDKEIKHEVIRPARIQREAITNLQTKQTAVNTDNETNKAAESLKDLVSVPHSVSNSMPGKNIFPSGTNKLQGSKKSVASFIEPFNSSGCAPFKVKFANGIGSYDSCKWTFGDGGSSTQRDPEWIFDVEGEYKIGLQVYTHDGKILSSSAKVTVHPHPQAQFEISPGNAILPEDEIRFRNYSTNASRFRWDFGDGSASDFFEPGHTYSKFNNYNVKLVAYSDWGCSDSLTVLNAFSGSEFTIEFPNAFIPNPQGPTGGYYSSKSDEAAQVFHPSYTGVTEYQLKIFSKLGIPIFESSDINLGWDGYNKGQLCDPGVYIWKVRGKYRNGEPFIKMGDVTLLQK